jgi:hypothetical protein
MNEETATYSAFMVSSVAGSREGYRNGVMGEALCKISEAYYTELLDGILFLTALDDQTKQNDET